MIQPLILLSLALPSPALAETACAEPTTLEDFLGAASRGEQSFAAMDLLGLSKAREQGLAVIPCLGQAVTTKEAAAFHRMMAMAAFTAGDEAGVLSEFHAARRLEPGYQIPETVAMEGHPLVDLYQRSIDGEEGSLDPTIPPLEGHVTVDGVRGAPRPTAISTIVQVFGADDSLEQSLYLLPGDPTPSWGPLPIDELRRKRRRVALSSAAGASLLAGGLLYGLSLYSEARFQDLDDPIPDADLPSQRDQTNALFFASLGAGAVGLGLGVVTVVSW